LIVNQNEGRLMSDTPQSDSTPLQACPVCGNLNRADARTCAKCGTQLVNNGQSAEDKKSAPPTGTVITSSQTEVTPVRITPSMSEQPANPPVPPSNPPKPLINPMDVAAPSKPASNPPDKPATNPPDSANLANPATIPADNSTKPIPEANLPPRRASSTLITTPEDGMQSATQVCPNCKHVNRAGVLLCENCGTNLRTGERTKIGTENFASGSQQEHDTLAPVKSDIEGLSSASNQPSLTNDQLRAVQTAGTAEFADDMILRLEVEGAPTPILVYPSSETIIGRRDPVTSTIPDVDLTAYAGYRMGVSRQHATLRLQNKILDIRDLGSSNGTFVNGIRLSAHQPHPLHDGDELALGKMVLKVFFQTSGRRRE
jgi:ribosomal protein L32